MNKVHRPLNLAQRSREASFFPVQGISCCGFLSIYRIAWTFGQIHFNVGPWQRQARAIAVHSSTWYTVMVATRNTKGP